MDQTAAIQTATDFIADRESFSPSPYWDVNGYAIGYGNHYYTDGSSVDGSDDPISQDDAYALLQFYVTQNANAIMAQVTAPITENQLAALTSLRYNCGTITTTLLGLINSGADPETIGNQIEITCTTAGGVSNSDLIARRQLEAALYEDQGITGGTSLLLVAAIGIGVYIMFIKK